MDGLHLIHKLYRYYGFTWYLPLNLFSNCHYAYNVFVFAHQYLTAGIGEPVFVRKGLDNSQARSFLHELMSAVRMKAEKEKVKDVVNFVKEFFRYSYAGKGEGGFREGVEFDFEGGGIGIVHTIINLGE